jgi:hypothetical protein
MKNIINVNGVKKLNKADQKSINGSKSRISDCYQKGELCCRISLNICGIGECNGRFCMWE